MRTIAFQNIKHWVTNNLRKNVHAQKKVFLLRISRAKKNHANKKIL